MSLSDVVKKVTDAPRKIKERAEEIGEATEKKYHQTREVPADRAATKEYVQREQENDAKLKAGKISQELHDARTARNYKHYEETKVPVEQRITHSAKEIGKNVASGAKQVMEKVAQDYRPSPPPKFGRSRGTKTTGGRTTVRKSVQPDFGRSPINFGNMGSGRGGAVDFGKSPLGGGGGGMRLGEGGRVDFSAPLFGEKKLRK